LQRRPSITLLSLLAFVCVLLLLTAVLLWSDSTRKLDRLLHDSWVRISQRTTPTDLVIVGIDPQSLQDHGRWPWSRSKQAELLDQLAAANVKGVVLDMLYTEPAANAADDRRLAEAMQALPKTVLPVLTENRVVGTSRAGEVERLPIPELLRHVTHLGQIQMPFDDDGIVRRVFLMAGYTSPHWPTLALAAHQAMAPESEQLDLSKLPGMRTLEAGSSGKWLQNFEVMIPFYGPRDAFTTVSAGAVIDGEVPVEVLENKVIFVGMTSVGLQDVVPTPVSALDQPIPGVEIHANLYAALRDGSLVTRIDLKWNILVALAMLPFLMWTYSRAGPEWSLAAALLAASVPIALSYFLYVYPRLWYPPLAASVPALISYLAWSGNRLRFVNRFLASQTVKLGAEQAPRDQHSGEELSRFFNHAGMHLPLQGWRITTRTQNQVGGNNPPPQLAGYPENWVGHEDVYSRRFPTVDRLEISMRIADADVAEQLTKYIDRLSRVRRRMKPSIWHGSIEQLQNHALKLADQLEWLRAVKAFSDTILDGSPTGFVVWNMVGEPIRLNKLTNQLLPKVGARPLLRDFVESVGLNPQEGDTREQFEGLIQQGEPWQFTVQQEERELLIGFSAVGEKLSERLVCATVIDVSEIRIAERARAEMMDYLSHDLRSPLVSSLYLLDADNTEVTQDELDSARRNIQSSLTMMDNLLHMSRADTVTVDTFKEVLLDNVIDNAVTRFLPQASARGITVDVSICEDELWLYGDAGLLDRAIGNLLSNAIKYSNENRKVWLDVSVQDSETAPAFERKKDAVVTVLDDGVGIDPAIIGTLFTRFKRDPSVAAQFKGIGLGLALVARVARQHGGAVTAHSSGKGAKFVFRVPLGLPLEDETSAGMHVTALH